MSSDRSLKQDIETLDSDAALDQIAALRPVAFTWKKTGAPDMGLIAQEVDLVYPELVTHGAADETLALKIHVPHCTDDRLDPGTQKA